MFPTALIARLTAMRKPLLVLLAAAVAALLPTPAYAGPTGPLPPYTPGAGLTATEVTFADGATTLHGSVVRRSDSDAAARHPGIVLVHGSGNAVRAQLAQEAEVFARAGIVTLIYDKRADYSRSHRDYSALADDALAGVALLHSLPDVDPAKIGLWGLSEGGWVAPLAASRSRDVSFLVTIGGSGLSPARTQAWNLNNRITRNGVADATAHGIVAAGMGLAVGLDQFPEADHDPLPVLRAVRQPVLAIWGELDTQVPPRESAEVFRRELTASPSVAIRILPHAGHAGRVTTDGYDRVGGPTIGGFVMGDLTPGYGDLMTSWVSSVTGGSPMRSTSDELPRQRIATSSVSPVGMLGFGVFALLLLALLSWPIWAVVRRARGRRGRPVGARPARWLVLTGLVGALTGVAYTIFMVAAGGQQVHAALLGQPLPWLIARLATVAALACTAFVALAWRSAPRADRVRLGVVGLGGVLLIPYALSLGLLVP
jgi:dienelactone hydrolase